MFHMNLHFATLWAQICSAMSCSVNIQVLHLLCPLALLRSLATELCCRVACQVPKSARKDFSLNADTSRLVLLLDYETRKIRYPTNLRGIRAWPHEICVVSAMAEQSKFVSETSGFLWVSVKIPPVHLDDEGCWFPRTVHLSRYTASYTRSQ